MGNWALELLQHCYSTATVTEPLVTALQYSLHSNIHYEGEGGPLLCLCPWEGRMEWEEIELSQYHIFCVPPQSESPPQKIKS